VQFASDTVCFKPAGEPICDLQAVILTLDELEALRLADLEGFYQETAARQMQISRQTFGNIIFSAHRKVAEALINHKYLKIEGGVITMKERHFLCSECKHEWNLPYGTGRPGECPTCHSTNIHRHSDDCGWSSRQGCCHGRRHGINILRTKGNAK